VESYLNECRGGKTGINDPKPSTRVVSLRPGVVTKVRVLGGGRLHWGDPETPNTLTGANAKQA